MTESVRQRFDLYAKSRLTWSIAQVAEPGLFCWHDHLQEDLGNDPDGQRFEEIANRMLSGRYYPPDALEFFGPWMDEGREVRVGDRILQCARLVPASPWPDLWAMTEVFVAERTETTCKLGYLTTKRHFGRGIWTATLSHNDSKLTLTVEAVTQPGSWLFWLGLPYARFLQMRAWRRSVEEFQRI